LTQLVSLNEFELSKKREQNRKCAKTLSQFSLKCNKFKKSVFEQKWRKFLKTVSAQQFNLYIFVNLPAV
jgi:hypothetical protein